LRSWQGSRATPRRSRAALIGSVALAIFAGGADAQGAKLTVSAKRPLYPAFSTSIHDYVVRCVPGRHLPLAVRAPRGTRVAVAGGRARRGSFTARPQLRTGQQALIATRTGKRRSDYHVRCLPRRFPDWTAQRSGRTQAAFYLVDPAGSGVSRYVTMFDANGVPVWWLKSSTPTFDAKLLPDGNVAWLRFNGTSLGLDPSLAAEEHTLTGRRVALLRTVGSPTDIHDILRLPNGDSLLLTYTRRDHVDLTSIGGPADATVLDGELQEITPKGKLAWSWNSKDHLATSEGSSRVTIKLPDGTTAYDLVHINSVEPHGKHLLISFRHANAVYYIEKKSGKVVWKLGGTQRPESLRFVGDSRGFFGSQHDARFLPDGTVTVYDNATGRGTPRAVRYRIDAGAGTATLLEQLTNPAVSMSNFAGSARRLPGGHWVISWGGTEVVNELAADSTPVFTLTFAKGQFSYRAFPVVRGTLGAGKLRAAMDAQYGRPKR
jgi:hypothetical protein